MKTACKCSDPRACSVRIARGLAPFCALSAPFARTLTFATASEADASKRPGETVKPTYYRGSKRFVIQAAS